MIDKLDADVMSEFYRIKLKEELGPFLIYVDSRYEDQVETNVGRKLFEMKRASKKYIQREKSNYSENE